MFSQRTKHLIACLFLSAFVFIKVSGLHAFMHHNRSEVAHCVLCHLSSRENTTPILAIDNYVTLDIVENLPLTENLSFYDFKILPKPKIILLLNRPPPLYTVS